jgi:hypothetical protein
VYAAADYDHPGDSEVRRWIAEITPEQIRAYAVGQGWTIEAASYAGRGDKLVVFSHPQWQGFACMLDEGGAHVTSHAAIVFGEAEDLPVVAILQKLAATPTGAAIR